MANLQINVEICVWSGYRPWDVWYGREEER